MQDNLVNILLKRSKFSQKGIIFIEGHNQEVYLAYSELYNFSLRVLSFLQSKGIKPKDELVFQLEDNKTFIVVFWACILGGIIPVPLSVGRNNDHRQKIFNVWKILNNPYLISSDENFDKLKQRAELCKNLDTLKNFQQKFINVEGIYSFDKTGTIFKANENDIAYVQFSSGSTGDPKGIILTHQNLITNAKAILKALKSPESGDTFFTWMPLTHDMGLIGFHITPLVAGWQHYIMPTDLFIRRPMLWLQKISQHRITFTASPNFGYRYVLNRFNEEFSLTLDLSCLRLLANGAEPISAPLCEEFTDKFVPFGLRKNVILPVYGLAEASLAVTFTEPQDKVRSLTLERPKLNVGDKIKEVNTKEGFSFVNVGRQLENCFLQICDRKGKPVGDKIIGRIRIKGDNVTNGYYNNSKATEEIISNDGWLSTGDLGFIHEGCLYITGREKDIIFINGQNFYPYDIERSLEVIDEIELGKVVVSGLTNQKSGEEEVLIFILHKSKIEKFIITYDNVKKHINRTFGFEPDYIIPVREIPKTTSGKIQRFKLIEEYTSGTFDEVIQEIKSFLNQQKLNGNYVESSNETEQKLAEIWLNVLLHDNFGVTQKFFEVGGNSLKGAQVISAIHKEFGIELNYSVLFEKQSIQAIAAEIERHKIEQYKEIPKIKEQEYYPLSSAQTRLYYIWEVDKKSIAYNIPVAFMIKGGLNITKLENAIIQLIERHEILRASFSMLNGEPQQKFNKKIDYKLPVTQIELKNTKDELKKRVKPYDLNNFPLFRIEFLILSNDRHLLFVDFHHIISDGVSISLFLDELFKIYNGEKLPELKIQYKDYLVWENKNIESEKVKKQSKYWMEQFNDEVPVLDLPTDFSRPPLMDYHGEKLEFQIDNALSTKLKNLAKQENTTLFALLLAVYNVLLSKYTGQEDIIVGVPVAVRNHTQLQSLLGMFVNNLAIRSYPQGSSTFKEFIKQIQNTSLLALNNQNYPFESIVGQIGQKRDVSRNSLFDTMLIYQNMELSQFQKENLSIEQYFFDPGFSKYDISLEIFDQSKEIKYFIEYSTTLFQKDTIIRFAKHFDNLLNTIIETPNAKLSDLSIISTEEYKKLVLEFNETKCDYPKNKVIHQLIEEQTSKHPDEIAVIMDGINKEKENPISNNQYRTFSILQLTYKELNEKSNQLANYLRKKGVVPNIPVALVLERTPELIIAILGILKAGGCYLPIDKDLPEERIKHILKDSQTNLVITDEDRVISNIQNKTYNFQFINITNQKLYTSEPTTISNINSPHNLAYIIYTSGTTGNPKGVMVEHQSLVNYTSFANKTYIKGEKVFFPLYTSISFDLTVTSIFTPLISGNTIVTYPDNEKSLPLEDVISDNQVHILKATPSHLKMLKEYQTLKKSDYFSNIKRLIVGGEALTTQLAKDIHYIFDEKIEIYNEYGPTEATVGCMIYKYELEKDKKHAVPIGIPVDNSQIYLLDKYLKPVPVGVEGEIYVSGDCLARGYIFKTQLTEEKFINNPFIPGQKMYKTGDMAKRLPDGSIEFIGRKDQQIKINGYRIEIEEIEQQILKCEYVREVVVIIKDELLCAYIVLNETEDETNIQYKTSFISHHLTSHLPGYMLPKYIIAIDEIPLTKNGKINYSLLPYPQQNKNVKVEATNEIQKAVVSAWQNVLNETKVGITDNFFELGGDSIKAVQIASRLFDKNISVNVKDILTYQTIEQLCLKAKITDGSIQYDQGIIEGEIKLNPVQKWFFEQNFKNPNFYNQSVLLKFKKPIDKEILQKTFEILIKHHDGLRLNYNPEKKVMFYNNDYLSNKFFIEEYTCKPEYPTSNILNICQQIKSSFYIENTLLIKAAIIKEGNSNLLFITVHHLIIDGISWRILMEYFYSIYKSLEKGQEINLPKKTASLIDWNNKLFDLSNREELKNQVEYWKEEEYTYHLLSFLPSLNRKSLVKDMQKEFFQLTEDETQFLLTEANMPYNTNIEILLVTALVKTLREWRNIDNIIIEIENYGRHLKDIEVSRTVGWFTSMFPVKFNFHGDNLGEQIKHVKEKIKKIPDGGIGYGILKYLNKSLNINSSLTEVRFNYLGQFENEINNDLFEYEQFNQSCEIDGENHTTAKIEINAVVINNNLQVEISFIKECSNSFIEIYRNNIKSIIFHLKNEKNMYFTPSDFDVGDLSSEELNELFNQN